MVGKEAIDIAGSEVFIGDHSEALGIALGWLDSCQFDNLVADHASFEIISSGLYNFVQHVVFRHGYEECAVLVDMDGAAVEGINHIVNVKPERVFGIQETDSFYESLIKVSIYTLVSLLVRFCESIPWNCVTDAAMIQLVLNYNQTRINVSKAVLRSVLSKTHHEKLIVAGQISGTIISFVSGSACAKVSTRYKRHKLSNYGFFLYT